MKQPGLACCMAAVFLASFDPALASTITAVNPLIQIEGRTMATPQQGLRIGYPGVALHLRVRGSTLFVQSGTTAGAADFDLVVDGVKAGRIRLPPQSFINSRNSVCAIATRRSRLTSEKPPVSTGSVS